MLLDELRDVLARPKFRRWASRDLATEFVDALEQSAMPGDDAAGEAAGSPDPDDAAPVHRAHPGRGFMTAAGTVGDRRPRLIRSRFERRRRETGSRSHACQ